jgi:hypothetical protein
MAKWSIFKIRGWLEFPTGLLNRGGLVSLGFEIFTSVTVLSEMFRCVVRQKLIGSSEKLLASIFRVEA